MSEKTETMVTMNERATADLIVVDVRSQLEEIVADFRTGYPRVTLESDLTDVTISVPDASFLDIAVRNLVENAIEHNHATDRWVRVSVDATADLIGVRVEDNGPSIPEMEREVLRDGAENPLRHGSGVGLWLAHWSVATAGGTILFDTRDPRGNVVTLEFPATEPRADLDFA